jgi:ABC-type phosphate/phosphonate transport system ATPase subunit
MKKLLKIIAVAKQLVGSQAVSTPNQRKSVITVNIVVSGAQGAGKSTFIRILNIALDRAMALMPFPVDFNIDIDEVQK